MSNVNLNRQVVSVKIGCASKRKRRHYKPLTVHHEECRNMPCHKPLHFNWTERVCIDFRLDDCQVLWRAVDLHPAGSLILENRGATAFWVVVQTDHHQPPVEERIPAHSQLALTLRTLNQIAVHPDTPHDHLPSIGRLRLNLILPAH
jgi:hypothetical protein